MSEGAPHAPNAPDDAFAPTPQKMPLRLEINGKSRTLDVHMHASLLDALRDAGYAGAKRVCETSDCAACAVIVDGRIVNACATLALQADSRHVQTIEGLAGREALHPLQKAFLEHAAAQCGFCIPGMILSLQALFTQDPDAGEIAIRDALGLCRCTGYVKPIDAALAYRDALRAGRGGKA